MVARVLSVIIILTFFVMPSAAGERRGHDHKEHGHEAHEHGAANLSVLVDGKTLEIELHVPGADIVGFEHSAESDNDRAAVARALRTLRENAKLFSPSEAAGCQITEAHAEYGKDQQYKADDAHRGFETHRIYTCKSPDRLEYIDVGLFQKFQTLKEVDAAVVGPRGQRGQELTPNDSRLKL
ncbi:MAG: hypothetical protein CFH10_00118 [Alphaproteobacteria bacterium MarineAlpha4_Bin2]|nr:MAG: hypothetical protein CFH10_00118 [Alphaproteobacteria bacterium MarineAlpha4_Bin2]